MGVRTKSSLKVSSRTSTGDIRYLVFIIVNATWLEVIWNHVVCETVFTEKKVTVFSYTRVNVGRHHSGLYAFFEGPALLLLLLLLLGPLSLSEGGVGV
jgi:hypothetical protein